VGIYPLTKRLDENQDLERLLELRWDNSIEYLEDEKYDCGKEYQLIKSKIESQLEDGINWQKYSKQIETMIKIYSDAKTVEEFFQKHKLPQFIVSITKEGDTKIEKLESTKELERQIKELKGRLGETH